MRGNHESPEMRQIAARETLARFLSDIGKAHAEEQGVYARRDVEKTMIGKHKAGTEEHFDVVRALTWVRQKRTHEAWGAIEQALDRYEASPEVRAAAMEIKTVDEFNATKQPATEETRRGYEDLPTKERRLRVGRTALASGLEAILKGEKMDRSAREFIGRLIEELMDENQPDLPAQLLLRIKAALPFESPKRTGLIEQAEELLRVEKGL